MSVNKKTENSKSEKLDPHKEVFNPHEEHLDKSEKEAKATFFVYMLVVCVCVGGFLFGYDTGGNYITIYVFAENLICGRLYNSHFWCFGLH